MAITFVNAGTAASADTGNITPGAPASPQVNDIWICLVENSSDPTAGAMSMTGDWTKIFDASGIDQTRLAGWWHRYTGVAPSRVVTAGGTGGGRIGGIAAFRGVKASGDPVNVVGTMNGADSNAAVHLSITPSVANCAIIACSGVAQDRERALPATFSAAFNPGDNTYKAVTAGNDTDVCLLYKLGAAASATGNISATILNAGLPVAERWSAILFALEEDVAGVASYVPWFSDGMG